MSASVKVSKSRDKKRRERGWRRVEVWLSPESQNDLSVVQADGGGHTVQGALCGALHEAALTIQNDCPKDVIRAFLAEQEAWIGHNDDGFSEGLLARAKNVVAGLKTIQQDTGLSAQASICKAIEDKAEKIRRK